MATGETRRGAMAPRCDRLVDYFVVAGLDSCSLCTTGGRQGYHGPQEKYHPAVLERVPVMDYAEGSLPQQLPVCVLPRGVSLITADEDIPGPECYPVVLTGSDGANLYASCLAFYDHVPQEMVSVHDSLLGSRALKCICLVSHWPFMDTFQKVLEEVFRATFVSGLRRSLSDSVEHLLRNIPVPEPGGGQVLFSVENSVLGVQCPAAGIPIVDISLQFLLRTFDQTNLQRLLTAVLLEQQILLRSSTTLDLTHCAEALRTLILPLVWTHVYVPVVPYSLVGAVEAPTPYLMGIHRELHLPAGVDLTGVVLVDLDEGSVEVVGRPAWSLPALPDPMRRRLLAQLRALAAPDVASIGAKLPCTMQQEVLVRDLQNCPWSGLHNSVLCAIFAEAVEGVLSDCEACLLLREPGPARSPVTPRSVMFPSSSSSSLQPLTPKTAYRFDRSYFLAKAASSQPDAAIPLFSIQLLETQAFSIYVDQLATTSRSDRRGHQALAWHPSDCLLEVELLTVLPPKPTKLAPSSVPYFHKKLPNIGDDAKRTAQSPLLRMHIKQQGHRRANSELPVLSRLAHGRSGSADAATVTAMQVEVEQHIDRQMKQLAALRTLLGRHSRSTSMSTEEFQHYNRLLCSEAYWENAPALADELLAALWPRSKQQEPAPRSMSGRLTLPGHAFTILSRMLQGLSRTSAKQRNLSLYRRVLCAGALMCTDLHGLKLSGISTIRDQDHWYDSSTWENLFLEAKGLGAAQHQTTAGPQGLPPSVSILVSMAYYLVCLHVDTESALGLLEGLLSRYRLAASQPQSGWFSRVLAVHCKYAQHMEDLRRKLANRSPPLPLLLHSPGADAEQVPQQLDVETHPGDCRWPRRSHWSRRDMLFGDGYGTRLASSGCCVQPRASSGCVRSAQVEKGPLLDMGVADSMLVTSSRGGKLSVFASSDCTEGCPMGTSSAVWTESEISCLSVLDRNHSPGRALCGHKNGNISDVDGALARTRVSIRAHSGGVTCLEARGVSSYGGLSGGRDGTGVIWDLRASKPSVMRFVASTKPIVALGVLDSSPLMTLASRDNNITVWDVRSGSSCPLWTLQGHQDGVTQLAFAGSGRVISSSCDWTARIWDLSSGTCEAVLGGHKGHVTRVVSDFSREWTVITGSSDSDVRVWVHKSSQDGWRVSQVLRFHAASITSLTVQDGVLVTGSADNMAVQWDLGSTSRLRQRVWRPKECHSSDPMQVRRMAWSPFWGLCTAAYNGTLSCWKPGGGATT